MLQNGYCERFSDMGVNCVAFRVQALGFKLKTLNRHFPTLRAPTSNYDDLEVPVFRMPTSCQKTFRLGDVVVSSQGFVQFRFFKCKRSAFRLQCQTHIAGRCSIFLFDVHACRLAQPQP